jgi:hypothetical protein
LRYLRLDLTRGLVHSWRGRVRGEPAGLDADRGLLLGVPVGLVTGFVEELRLRRAARTGDPDRSTPPQRPDDHASFDA